MIDTRTITPLGSRVAQHTPERKRSPPMNPYPMQALAEKLPMDLDPDECSQIANKLILELNKTAPDLVPSAADLTPVQCRKFRNWLDLALKLTNTANRKQVSVDIMQPDKAGCTVYCDAGVEAKLLYLGNGLFARLILADKGGRVNRTPVFLPLSAELNRFMALYLYKTNKWRKGKRSELFPDGEDGKKNWRAKHGQHMVSYMLHLLDVRSQDRSKKQWKQHMLRTLFLNRIGLLYDYDEQAFEHTSILMRHTTQEMHKSYIDWTRLAHLWSFHKPSGQPRQDLKFPPQLLQFYNDALQYCQDTFYVQSLDSQQNPNPVVIPRKPKKADMAKQVEQKNANTAKSHADYFIGIDTSPNCTAVCILQKQGSNYEYYIYHKPDKKPWSPPDDARIKYTSNCADVFEAVLELCERRRPCVICVEAPLKVNKTVDKAQVVYTRSLVSGLQEMKHWVVQTPPVDTLRRVWWKTADIELASAELSLPTSAITNIKNYRVYVSRTTYPTLDIGESDLSGYRHHPQIQSHPVADIVDATVVNYWVVQWSKYAMFPKEWVQ